MGLFLDRTDKEIYDRIAERIIQKAEKTNCVIFLLGDTDSGKTHFAINLIKQLLNRKIKSGFVDGDIGQSKIGPPTTIGLSMPANSNEIFSASKLYFVGSTSPKGHMLPLVVGTKKLTELSRTENSVTIIDTTGTIYGQFGFNLKINKIQVIEPEIILAFKKSVELNHIINAIQKLSFSELIILTSNKLIKPKALTERYENRKAAFLKYFENAIPQTIDTKRFDRMIINKPYLPQDIVNRIFCAWNTDGYANSIGVIEEIRKDHLILFAPIIDLERIAYFEVGGLRLNKYGDQL